MGCMYSWGTIKRVLLSVAKLLVCNRVHAKRDRNYVREIDIEIAYGANYRTVSIIERLK